MKTLLSSDSVLTWVPSWSWKNNKFSAAKICDLLQKNRNFVRDPWQAHIFCLAIAKVELVSNSFTGKELKGHEKLEEILIDMH